MSLADMRKELREMRKETVKPVSRMRKGDISAEIEALRNRRETTPAPAATPSAAPRKMQPEVEKLKDVKKSVFMKVPGAPVKDKMTKASAEKPAADLKSKPKASTSVEKSGKNLSKAELLKMIQALDE
jgi:hypothetical protein